MLDPRDTPRLYHLRIGPKRSDACKQPDITNSFPSSLVLVSNHRYTISLWRIRIPKAKCQPSQQMHSACLRDDLMCRED